VFVGRSNTLTGKNQPSSDFGKMFTRLGIVSKNNAIPGAPAKVD
jgi:hypothetical protein